MDRLIYELLKAASAAGTLEAALAWAGPRSRRTLLDAMADAEGSALLAACGAPGCFALGAQLLDGALRDGALRQLLAAAAPLDGGQDLLDRALLHATLHGDVTGMKALKAAGADLGVRYEDSALGLVEQAAFYGHVYALAWLVMEGADTRGAVMCAVQGNQPEALRRLLDLGADPEDPGAFDDRPLCLAVRENALDLAWVLLDAGAGVRDCCLARAVREDHAQMVRLLLNFGADPRRGTLPAAVRAGCSPVTVRALLGSGIVPQGEVEAALQGALEARCRTAVVELLRAALEEA